MTRQMLDISRDVWARVSVPMADLQKRKCANF